MQIKDDGDNNDNRFLAVYDNNEQNDDDNNGEDKYKSKGSALARPRASHTTPDLGGLQFAFAQGGIQEQW